MNKNQFPTRDLRLKEGSLYLLKDQAINKLEDADFSYIGLRPNKSSGYEVSLCDTLLHGKPKFDRTGTDTIGIHGYQSRFNLDDGFPLVTTKKVHLKSVIHELIWLISGDTNIKYLVENGVTIWSDWPLKNYNNQHTKKIQLKTFEEMILAYPSFAKEWGDLGPVYGKQWRKWSAYNLVKKGYNKLSNPADKECSPEEWIPDQYEHYTIDQLGQVVEQIKKQHETGVISRRMLVSAWNVADVPLMIKSGLPPCHCLFQFHSRLLTLQERLQYWAKKNDKDISFVKDMTDDDLDLAGAPVYELDLQLYQRSCDIFLGVPFNIASYSLLLMMVAQVTNCKPGTFIHDYGDLHIYSNHIDQVVEQLSRSAFPYPTMKINPEITNIDDFKFEDFKLENYQCHPAIKADVAV